MRKLIVFLGLSGSGKTTCSRYVSGLYGLETVHCIQPVYDMLSKVTGLDAEYIKQEKRNIRIGSSTVQTLLVALYHLCAQKDINLGQLFIEQLLRSGESPLVLEAVRNFSEVDLLTSLPVNNVCFIHLSGGKTETSDILLAGILAKIELSNHIYHSVDIYDTIQGKLQRVADIVGWFLMNGVSNG